MTLRELRAAHPHLFHPTQDWFAGEAFLDAPARDVRWPVRVRGAADALPLANAATLAALYVQRPGDALWSRYLWTTDRDGQGQQVYLGANGRGLEIHRHLHLTARWGVPCWA